MKNEVSGKLVALTNLQTEMEAEMLPDYGSVLIGKNRNVNAVLRFKYYRYVGERLKK